LLQNLARRSILFYRRSVEEAMSVHQDRRDAKSVRIPFEAIVEIGGDLPPGSAFEAQSIDLSVSGMHLRTAYLPDVGQALLCRFGSGAEDISAEAEVVWRREESRGGEFGIRFTNLDGGSAGALCQMCGLAQSASSDEESQVEAPPGTRVRLHIDGLGSPMKARVRGATESELLVGSNLEFLRVGRQLELEDVDRGGKRPAHIDRVDIEMERDSRVPQLVVTLRYDDVDAAGGRPSKAPKDGTKTADASLAGSAESSSESESSRLVMLRRRYESVRAKWSGSPVARAARRFGSSMSRWGGRAKATAGLLWARAIERSSGDRTAIARRMTSPPPSGALHAMGKRVVREQAVDESDEKPTLAKRPRWGKIGMALGAGASILVLAVLMIALLRKSPAHASATAANDAKVATSAASDPALAANPLAVTDGGVASAAPEAPTDPSPTTAHIESVDDTKTAAPAEPNATATLVPTFGYGKVSHAVIVQVKMDGPIGVFHGVRMANGFTVTMPGRRTLDRSALLGRADPRLAAVKVVNHAKGTELTFEFRNAVPAYLVRARGDRLQIALGQLAAAPSHGPVATRTTGAEHVRVDHRSARSNATQHSTDKAATGGRR
jgi:hypothetical protein